MGSSSSGSSSVLVCGAGSIGCRHINNLKSLGVKVCVWRSRTDLANQLGDEYSVRVFTSLDEALEQVDAVLIATATNTHLEIAMESAKRGKAIFIEKPVSHSIVGVKEFSEFVQKKNLVVEIGFQLRAHRNIKKLYELTAQGQFGPLYTFRAVVGQRLDTWRPGTNYRNCYSSDAQRGGGALLDLTHEIDLVQWIAGPIVSVQANLAHVSDLEINAEDLVNMIVVTSSGAVGQIQLDMLSPDYRRGLELVYQNAVFCWNYVTGILECRTSGEVKIMDRVPDDFNRNSLFLDHMQHFLNRLIYPNLDPLCSLNDGINCQRICEAARLSSDSGLSVALNEISL